jgi:diguanylate cyclase (GGDEF)-like protein
MVQPAGSERRHSTLKLFATFAAIMLVPVILLGVVLAASYRNEEDQRGLAQGRSEAVLMAQTAVEPVLDGRPLSQGLRPSETADMNRLVRTSVRSGDVLRLRLRDLSGTVVYSDDGSGLGSTDDQDEAVDAADGDIQAHVTRLNADSTDAGPLGPFSVEIYLPLRAGTPSHRVGVLEVYLPYAPIRADVQAGVNTLYRNLAIGLGLLYLLLFAISFSVGRRLRREVKLNAYMAEHDALTDLPNRTLFHRRVAAELTRGRRRGRPTTIAIIDLDRFKEINDTLGHHNGDRLLAALSTRMASHLRGLDALARLGGDEFGILLADVGEPEEILLRLRDVIEHEISIAGLPISVEASIGYVVAPEHGTDVDELLQLADVAMYVAKDQHLGVVRYDPSQNHYDAANLTLMSELRHAIESDQLVLHYQPKVGIDSGGIEAVEALVRWNHPSLGLLYPDRFIPQVEQTDLIDRLTEWVVRRALEDLTHFGPDADTMTVAVNVSARNLGRAGFAGKIVTMLDEVGVSADRLYIEVTETALMTDPTRAATVLAELNAAGVLVSIDDFGTGQTSLGYLSTLPIGELKIDRSFIADMIDEPGHAAIVHSIAELGHSLGFRVVGEGIESREILDALAATGCDVAQGYFFARPMPADDLVRWLATQHEPSASQLTR